MDLVPDGAAIPAALDYNLRRWSALGHFLANDAVGVDDNHITESTSCCLIDGPRQPEHYRIPDFDSRGRDWPLTAFLTG